MDPVEFCPAAARASSLARFESLYEQVEDLMGDPSLARQPKLAGELEALACRLLLEIEEARTQLAGIEAVSSAGAIAQLLAAIRDIRVGDDAERERAKQLEARAVGFLAAAGLFDGEVCRRLSQTRFTKRRSATACATAS